MTYRTHPRRRARRVSSAISHDTATTHTVEVTRPPPAATRGFQRQNHNVNAHHGPPMPEISTEPRHPNDRTAQWVENERLIQSVTTELGGTWPTRELEAGKRTATIGQSAREDAFGGVTGTLAARENVPGMEGERLTREVLSPQARDAITALGQDETPVDSDVVLRILNARAVPETCLPNSVILTEVHETVAWEALLSPQAQAALDALAREGRVVDADEMLSILNGTVEESSKSTRDVADLWMVGLVSPQAQHFLATRSIGNSDEVLAVLNGGFEMTPADARAELFQDPDNSWKGVPSAIITGAHETVAWEALLNPQAKLALNAPAREGRVVDADEMLRILNGTVEESSESTRDVADPCMVSLVGPQAEYLLAKRSIGNSDELLAILNSGDEMPPTRACAELVRNVQNAWMAALLSLAAQVRRVALAIWDGSEHGYQNVYDADNLWIAGLLSPQARARLTAVARQTWKAGNSDRVLAILNAGNESTAAQEAKAEDVSQKQRTINTEADTRMERASFDDVLAELHAQLGNTDESEDDSFTGPSYTHLGSLFERNLCSPAMSMTSEASATSLFAADTPDKRALSLGAILETTVP
ncbi:hypothetical protein B0H17DRAFT_1246121 [Mycena rosella]|uniref:Uncharacterized protein n=1 Tax=Mycena rosella TaxID=1033263 RepID=A0AAD7CYK0_MYCRO|nr:hypothetical protein B0H17DRAFT_1246121 [Mycena rosella]